MREDNPIRVKSKQFAVKIINLYKYLSSEGQECVMSKQLLRSGTSIGANIAEALCGISKKDFLAKMYIAFKESIETQYWLDILYETKYIPLYIYNQYNEDCTELSKMLSSITKSTNESLSNNS